MDLVEAVRTWWTTELPSETALLEDQESFFRDKAAEISLRRVSLQASGLSDEAAFEQALWELLPTSTDLDDPSASPQQLEARAGDAFDGWMAWRASS